MVENPFDDEIRVGEVVRAQSFPETNKQKMVKLWIDLGDEEVQSAAQLGYNHDPASLPGRQVLCATTLGTVRIAGFESDVLTVCVPDEDDHPVLVEPNREVPLGGLLF